MSVGIQTEFLKENTHKLLDVLQLSAPGRMSLPINDAVLEPSKVLCSMLASVPHTAKHVEEMLFCPGAGI